MAMFGNRESDDDMSRDMSAILRRADAAERPPGAVVQMRPVSGGHGPPLENTAIWIRSLRYEDMMQMATEMHGIRASDPVDTPEQLARLVHAWAKATTEPSAGSE